MSGDVNMKDKICPIMAKGWLANEYAAMPILRNTFHPDRLPRCLKEKCACWITTGDEEFGYCGLATEG
jgi:hypothetical protein